MLFIYNIALSLALAFGNPYAERSKAKEDFARINKTLQAEKLSVEMVYNYYEQQTAYVPGEVKAGIYYRNGACDYSRILDIETLHTPELTVVADHEDKLITVSGPISARHPLAATTDTLLSFCKEIKSVDMPDNKRLYELVFNPASEMEYEKIQLVFDLKDYRLSRFTFFFKTLEKTNDDGSHSTIHPKMEVLYKNYNKVAVSGLPVFKVSNYVAKISENKYRSSGKYSTYKVYNQKFK
ncbi:MAG: hypothetical protein ACXVP0_11375 [Bacteroidia bacterium]